MKRILLLAFVVLAILIVVNRQRIFVRDPLAAVYKSPSGDNGRNAVRQTGVEVFVNYPSDMLLIQPDSPGAYSILVQHWSKMPGAPIELKCIRGLACLTTAAHAPTIPIAWTGKGPYDPQTTMTGTEVSFMDGDGAMIRVVLQ